MKLFGLDHIRLVFEEDALEAIAEEALARNTGARGLRAIMEQFMMQLMYELPSDEDAETVTITRAFIKGEGDALVTRRVPALTEQSVLSPAALETDGTAIAE